MLAMRAKLILLPHYENLPMQYTEIFWALKSGNFHLNLFYGFLILCSKHRFWVHVRTASMRRFYRVPTIYVLEQK